MAVRDTRRTRVALAVLLAVAVGLIALSYSDSSNGALRTVRNAGSSVFGGVEHAASSVTSFFSGGSTSSAQVRNLQKQVLRLRAELSQEQLNKADYAQLHKLLLLAGAAQYRVVAASVIAVGTGYQQAITIDAGSSDGIRTADTVINGQGLVGVVTAVTSTTATVQLASSSATVVGAAVAPSGQLGWVTGPGKGSSGLMQLRMLSSAASLKPGDQLVTSASVNDKPYVPGVPIGVVSRLLSQNGLTEAAVIKPYVDYSALSVVGVVITPPRHNPRFAALPPLPRPVPTVTVTVTARPGAKPKPSSSPSARPGG